MSSCKIYVGNLAWATDENALGSHFTNIGSVKEAVVMRSEGRSRGFGFVTFTTADEAERAIATMNDTELHGRRLRVNVANQQIRTAGMGAGDHSGGGGSGQGYHYPSGGYPGGAPHHYPGGPYGGYPQSNPSHHGGAYMAGYGMNAPMNYGGSAAPGYEAGSSTSGQASDNRKAGSQSGGFYPAPAPYAYPPVGYGQQPY